MQLMTRRELCDATGGKLTMWTIGELTRRGEMPVIKLKSMRVYLYDFEAVMAWLDGLQGQQQGLSLAK